MLRKKTNKQFDVQIDSRGKKKAVIVRFIINSLEFYKDKVYAKGYYYYKDETLGIVKLSDINTLVEKATIEALESGLLDDLTSKSNIFINVFQRLEEFMQIKFESEAGENYGTVISDWIDDND